jgi:hypothetical protein
MAKLPEIVAVEAITDKEAGLKLNEENVEKVNRYGSIVEQTKF